MRSAAAAAPAVAMPGERADSIDVRRLARALLVVVAVGSVAAAVWGGTRAAAPPVVRHAPTWRGLAALPPGARGVVTRRLGAADERFWARRAGAEAAFGDPRVGIGARLSAHGVIVRAGSMSWSIGLRAWGRGMRLHRVPGASAAVRANRVTLMHRGGLMERYDYGPLGLEQGFTIGRRPSGRPNAPVVLALGDVPRGLDPVLAPDRRSMSLKRGPVAMLRYWGLFASDARGRALPAEIAVSGRALSLRVDDRRAVYPVRVDPFVQAGKLTASNGATGDGLGSAVAVSGSGDTIAVGAPDVNSGRGAVLVFVKPAGGWADGTETATLTASDGAGNNLLGTSVAMSGDTIVAGAPRATVSGHQAQGAAYVFNKPPGGWTDGTENSKLTATDGATSDQFGSSVATDGATIAVGAQWASPNAFFGAGAAYVFVNGAQVAKLLASGGQPEDNFGSSIGVSGDTVAVGAGGARNLAGAVYVFVKPAGGWANSTQTAMLTASDGAQADHLGMSVGVSGDTVAAGATGATVGAQRPGAVYVFVKPAGGWSDVTQTAKLSASQGAGGDDLGWSLAIGSDTVVAGAPGTGGNFQGALYVFSKPPGGWADGTENAKLTPADEVAGDGFGESAAITSDAGTVAAGSPQSGAGPGAAYVFTSGGGGGPRSTTTSVSCSPGSVAVGQGTTCTATVTDTGSGAPVTPTGTVNFGSDSQGTFGNLGASCALGQVSASQASCHVDYKPSAVGSGTHRIAGTYGGDAAHAGSAGSGTVGVTSTRPTSTSVLCFPATVVVGASAGCRATVTDTGNGPMVTPTGTVRFSSDSHGTFAGPSCTLTAVNAASAGCLVTYTPAAIDSGVHTITVAYDGDAAHGPSSGGLSLGVTPGAQTPPQNLQPPSIVPDRSCQLLLGQRQICRTIPYQYFCDPGQWTGANPGAYQFEWQQLYYTKQGIVLNPFWQTVGTSQTYYAAQHLTPYIASGAYRCLVTATGPGGSAVANSAALRLQVGPPLPRGVRFPAPVNVIVTGIEVTQAVQSFGCAGCTGSLPSRSQLTSNTPGRATYQGVTLAAGKFTVVRVFAHFLGSPATFSGATAQLEVLDSNGNRISTLSPDSSPASLTPPICSYCVNPAERADPSSSFNFLVPWQETYHSSLSFRATVTPPSGLPAAAFGVSGQCGGCLGNTFTLDSVPFVQTPTIPIHPIPLITGGLSGPCGTSLALRCTKQPPQQVLSDAETMMPFHFQIFPYRPPLSVGTQTACQAAATVSLQGAQDGLGAGDYGLGVFFPGEGSLQNGCTLGGYTLFDNGAASAVQDDRPITSVAHEIGHGLSLAHADTGTPFGACPPFPFHSDNCGPHPDGTPDCGGNSNGQTGETWPPGSGSPDNEGRLDGIGLDRRTWDIFQTGSLPSTFVEGFDHTGKPTASTTGGARYYDFMSYCPSGGIVLGGLVGGHYQEPLDWISLTNWNRLLAYHRPAQTLPPAADRQAPAADGTPLRVTAIVGSDGNTSVFAVSPGQRTLGGPTAGSPYRIELRDAGGNVLESVVPTTGEMHIDFSGKSPEVLLDATLPFAPATAAAVVTANGRELARRARSAHAPAARFLSPGRGALLGRRRSTVIRWSARDADGDALSSTVEYSADGGRHWAVVAGPLTGTSARVPSRFLSASRNARLRVQISDGFNLTTVTSGRLRARGAPPAVQILNAPRRGHVLETTMLLLQGSAFDDADHALTGRHLKWYLGKRLIGTGEQVTARGLPPGRIPVRLVATDSHGRSSTATLPLQVRAVAARYLLFDAPLLVSRRARTVRVRVAASEPATFTIAGRRYSVGPRPRTITVRIRRGRSLLRLRCALRSPGGVVRGTYFAIRR